MDFEITEAKENLKNIIKEIIKYLEEIKSCKFRKKRNQDSSNQLYLEVKELLSDDIKHLKKLISSNRELSTFKVVLNSSSSYASVKYYVDKKSVNQIIDYNPLYSKATRVGEEIKEALLLVDVIEKLYNGE